jgi:two-component system LytT family response regulator
MLTTIVVDDEPLVLKNILFLLEKYCPQVQVLATAESAAEAKKLIEQYKPDLLLLDIEMPRGNGFDLLQSLKDFSFSVVFITAYEQYAIQAIKFSALDYILKPINHDDLVNAVNKAAEKIKDRQSTAAIEMLLQNYQQPSPALQKIALPASDKVNFAKLADIMYIKSEGNYTQVFLKQGNHYFVTKAIGYFEDILPAATFQRIHNEYIINLNYLEKYVRGKGGFVILENGTRIDVSARRKTSFTSLWKL